MRTYYFVGGPTEGNEEEFFRRLEALGGIPTGWRIYPHADDRRALHVVLAQSTQEVLDHLERFRGIYEHGAIVEVKSPLR